MISSLYRMAAGPVEHKELGRQLRVGPWCWPPESDVRRMTWAHSVAGPLPSMTVGRTLGLTVCGQTAILWAIELGGVTTPHDMRHLAELGPETVAAWRTAALSLPRALPVLWKSVARAAENPPRLVRIASADETTSQRVVDGPSFGLSFILILASQILDVALPGDIAASAEVHPDGTVRGVSGLETKIEGLVHLAPRVSRLFVASEQKDKAQALAAGRIEVVPISSAAEGLQKVFGDRLARNLIEAADQSQRQEIIGSLFRLAFAGRGTAIDWTPIEAAAGLALNWDALNDDERYQLEFARAVAARHERNAGVLPTPAKAWLDRQPRPIQVGVATHMLQQSADAGIPDPAAAEEIARPFLPADERSAYQSQLRLLGAQARLWAVIGRPREALDLQQRIARAFFDAFEYGEMSFQLSEWFRLSGALEDRAAYERAEELYQRVLTLGAFGLGGSAYIDLARARAMVMVGITSGNEPVTALDRLATSGSVPEHVRWSAARWAIRAHLARGAGDRAVEIRAQLDGAAALAPHGSAAKHATLAALDRCVAEGADCRPVVARLREIERGLIGHLVASAPAATEANYIARFYPY